MTYDKKEVQTWINEIEDTLEEIEETDVNDIRTNELYDDITRHYEFAEEKIMSEGLSEEACYELERALDLVEAYDYNKHLNNNALEVEDEEE